MRPMNQAPRDRNVLVRVKTYAYKGSEWEQTGHKTIEAYFDGAKWRAFTGNHGITSTEMLSPVGWWPLPGNESTFVDMAAIPDGWWLYSLGHNHTPIRFKGEVHEPFGPDNSKAPDRPYTAQLQRVKGGLLTVGHGRTAQEALDAVVFNVECDEEARESGGMEER